MKALASSLGAWECLESNERTKGRHGLTFALAVLQAIGAQHGLELHPEEQGMPARFDAVFVSVFDARTMLNTRAKFDAWRVPMRRRDRGTSHPLVWAGGQGLHNPMPYYDIADVIVIGDAEEPLPALLAAWERHGNGPGFLTAAAMVPGVLVPSLHDPSEVRIKQAVANDVGITLRQDVRVNLNGLRRIEIARSCKHKCLFCGLGWRAPMRENPAKAIIRAIGESPKALHLQAGDAEAHSGIAAIRAAMAARGAQDAGWTGRLDSVEGEDAIAGSKRYAFGVEGMTWRVRKAVGKGYLTDERLIASTVDVMRRIEGDGKGRTAWHMIAGLPGERRGDTLAFAGVLQSIDRRMRGQTSRNLTLHWQPFQPLPGTPMQWCACGGGARQLIGELRGVEHMPWVPIRQQAGRTDGMAKLCTVLARAGRRGADVLDAGIATPEHAAELAGVGWGELDPDAPLPWDWIEHHYPRSVLRKGFEALRRQL